MDDILLFFASPIIFWIGNFLMFLSIITSFWSDKKVWKNASIILIVAGIAIAVLAGSPRYSGVYLNLLSMLILFFYIGLMFFHPRNNSVFYIFRVALIWTCYISSSYEYKYWDLPEIDTSKSKRMIILGDSFCMPHKEDQSWWDMFEDEYKILNLSKDLQDSGEVIERLEIINSTDDIIILSVGNEDVRNEMLSKDFGKNLRKIAIQQAVKTRSILIFELQSSLFQNRYSAEQHKVADSYNEISLLNRRFTQDLLNDSKYSDDKIHLNTEGHKKFYSILKKVFVKE